MIGEEVLFGLEGFSWVGIGLVSLEGLVEIGHCYREGEHLKIYSGIVIYDDGPHVCHL